MKDVHTEHCCAIHGCKYHELKDCTVVTKGEPQSYPCEICDEVRSEIVRVLQNLLDEAEDPEVWLRKELSKLSDPLE